MSTPPQAVVSGCGSALDAVSEADTPRSNHGVFPGASTSSASDTSNRAPGADFALFDFLSFTVRRGALRVVDPANGLRYRLHGADEDCETAKVLPASEILDALLPGSALSVDAFSDKGRFGYKQSADLYAPGMNKPVGFMAREGNADTVLVSVSGAGMFAVNVAEARPALEHFGATITRIDAAFDDFEGQFLSMEQLRYDAICGMFDGNGKPTRRSYVDDLGTGRGCSLYIGSKGSKEGNAYEKGKQQGDPDSPWIRFEARLWADNRHIPVHMLLDPLGVIFGAYPWMRSYLPLSPVSRAKSMRAQVEANAGAMTAWVTEAAGRTLSAMRESAKQAGCSDSQLLDLITRDGMPGRFAGIPEPVAIFRTANYLKEAMKS